MALIPYVFNDVGLTDQFDDATDTLGAQAVNGSSGDGVFYVGTTTSGNKLEDNAAPGVADITVTIVDSNGPTDVDAVDIKLATSSGGLDSAVGGAALTLGTTINFGAPAAVYYRWTNDTGTGTYTDISLEISAIAESAI